MKILRKAMVASASATATSAQPEVSNYYNNHLFLDALYFPFILKSVFYHRFAIYLTNNKVLNMQNCALLQVD